MVAIIFNALYHCYGENYYSSFEFQGAMHFNNFPEYIRVIKGCKQFKAALLKITIHSCFLCLSFPFCLFVVVLFLFVSFTK